MSWMEELYQVYERHQDRIGYEKTHDAILLPIYHSTANRYTYRGDHRCEGNFRSAKTVDKEDAVTIIPVTMDSAARSSGIAPSSSLRQAHLYCRRISKLY